MKKLKSAVAFLLAATLAVTALFGCSSSSDASEPASSSEASTDSASSDEVVTIDVWGWETEELQKESFDDFHKQYPNINISMTLTESKDMTQRVQTALASGSKMPDIAWLEISQRGKLLSLDCWADLTKDPFNVDTSKLISYMLPLATNSKGELVGIDDAPSMACLAYKRELAEEYLGVSEPADVQALFSSWDEFIEKGKEVRDKSNGEVFMFTGPGDVMTVLKGQNNTPFVVDGTLNLKAALGDPLNKIIEMKDAGIIDVLDQDTPSWNASMGDRKHIFYPSAHWSPQWVIKPNDEEEHNTWGLIISPGGGFPYGGTAWAISKEAEHPEEAWTFLNWFLLTDEGAINRRDKRGYYSALASLYEDPDFYSAVNARFGGQDISKFYTQEVLPSVTPTRQVFEYDMEVNDAINLALKTIASSTEEQSADALVKMMEDDVHGKVPDLQPEE